MRVNVGVAFEEGIQVCPLYLGARELSAVIKTISAFSLDLRKSKGCVQDTAMSHVSMDLRTDKEMGAGRGRRDWTKNF